MISIVLSKSVDKSNTKYYDVVIKWVNITNIVTYFVFLVPYSYYYYYVYYACHQP